MDNDILREAVELAEGFSCSDFTAYASGSPPRPGIFISCDAVSDYCCEIHDGCGPELGFDLSEEIPKWLIAALASQLISQVDAMAPDVVFNSDFSKCALIYSESRDDDWHAGDCKNPSATNRDENSIIACTEFLRGLKDGD